MLAITKIILDLTLAKDRYAEFTPDGPYSSVSVVRLDVETWDDMGNPEQITVTVEPGDRLNDDASGEPPPT